MSVAVFPTGTVEEMTKNFYLTVVRALNRSSQGVAKCRLRLDARVSSDSRKAVNRTTQRDRGGCF